MGEEQKVEVLRENEEVLPKTPDKQQIICLLYQDGVPVRKIAKQLKVTDRWVRKVLQKFRISPLTEPTIIHAAIRTIKNHSQGKPARKGLPDPKDNVVQRAAEFVHDSAFPKTTIVEKNSHHFIDVDLSGFQV